MYKKKLAGTFVMVFLVLMFTATSIAATSDKPSLQTPLSEEAEWVYLII